MLKLLKKIIAVFILIIAIYVLSDFNLRLPSGMIRLRYLISTPIGTNMSDVVKYLQKNNYEIWSINDFGYKPFSSDKRQGDYHIKSYVGEYRWIFNTDVLVIWVFDKDKKLIEIIVRKQTDAL